MTTLYTGFKGAGNSSYMMISRIAGEKLFLTNSFTGLKKDIENLSKDYNRVYMFGLDKSLKNEIRIEECAQRNNRVLYTTMDSKKIANALTVSGIHCVTSDIPTHYLCNEAYYSMLEKYNRNAIFIHLPSSRYITKEFVSSMIDSLIA